MLFNRKKPNRQHQYDPVFQRYQRVIELIKPLNKRQYTILKNGMDKIHDGYLELEKIKTEDEIIEEMYVAHPDEKFNSSEDEK